MIPQARLARRRARDLGLESIDLVDDLLVLLEKPRELLLPEPGVCLIEFVLQVVRVRCLEPLGASAIPLWRSTERREINKPLTIIDCTRLVSFSPPPTDFEGCRLGWSSAWAAGRLPSRGAGLASFVRISATSGTDQSSLWGRGLDGLAPGTALRP